MPEKRVGTVPLLSMTALGKSTPFAGVVGEKGQKSATTGPGHPSMVMINEG